MGVPVSVKQKKRPDSLPGTINIVILSYKIKRLHSATFKLTGTVFVYNGLPVVSKKSSL